MGAGSRLTGPEFEVEVRPRRGPSGSDLDEATTDYAPPNARKPG